MRKEPTTQKELKSVNIREANNGFTISRYTEHGESLEVATTWSEAAETAAKLMGVKSSET